MATSQWLLVCSLLGLLFSLFIISKVNIHRATSLLPIEDGISYEKVGVTITGEVAKPGTYFILSGAPLSEAVRKARPKPWADLQKIPLDKIVEEPCSLNVEALEEIHVRVGGAVAEPVELTLPRGSRISDLKTKIILTPEADKTFFRRRKLLKNGERIEVPNKAVE